MTEEEQEEEEAEETAAEADCEDETDEDDSGEEVAEVGCCTRLLGVDEADVPSVTLDDEYCEEEGGEVDNADI